MTEEERVPVSSAYLPLERCVTQAREGDFPQLLATSLAQVTSVRAVRSNVCTPGVVSRGPASLPATSCRMRQEVWLVPLAGGLAGTFSRGTIASRDVCGPASGRGAPSSCGWNFHRAALADSPAVLLNLRLSAVLPGAKVDSGPPSWEDHG